MKTSFFEWTIGMRYLKPRRRYGFISIISFITLFTICLGVASLIIVLSVMNGFQTEIRNRLLSVTSHIELSEGEKSFPHWSSTINRLLHEPHVVSAAPFVNAQALVSHNGNVRGVVVRGIVPQLEKNVVSTGWSMTHGSLDKLVPGDYGIVLGETLAQSLGVQKGGHVTLIVPQGNITPMGTLPRLKEFVVVGTFHAQMAEYDVSLVLASLKDTQTLFRMKNSVSGIRLRLDDPLLAPEVKHHLTLSQHLPATTYFTDWTDVNANYFRAVQIEKRMMLIILSIIVLVAAFGLVSTLYMMVNDKRADIAILRTLGASPASIMRIFIIQGMATGTLGTLLGGLIGVVASWHIATIEKFIEYMTGAKILENKVYLVDYLPSEVQSADVALILILSLTLSFLATLYPSLSAAHTQPSEALRYE